MSQIRIKEITVCNFRAFATTPTGLTIKLPKGENLLVYGENGAGKSSLFLALKGFFESCNAPLSAPKPFEQNIFRSAQPGHVRLRLSNQLERSWPDNSGREAEPVWLDANRVKAAFDYKAMLQTHFLPRGEKTVDLFGLFFVVSDGLLRGLTNPSSTNRFKTDGKPAGKTFGDNWDELCEAAKAKPRGKKERDYLNLCLGEFNTGLAVIFPELEKKTNEFLSTFQTQISIAIEPAKEWNVRCDKTDKAPVAGKTRVEITFNSQILDQHQDFLNEARLSALALSIFLAARKIEPAAGLRLLLLDDVLIGLDMSNRLYMLEIIKTHFIKAGYQLVLTTYDRAWFETVRRWKKTTDYEGWREIEIFAGTWGKENFPVVRDSKTSLLEIARDYWENHEYKAAGVYVRTHFEKMLKEFCADNNVPVPYCEYPAHPKAENFWGAVQDWLKEKNSPLQNAMRYAVIEAKEIVLNPSAHDDSMPPFASEVMRAILAVESLEGCLNTFGKRGK